MVEDCSVQVFQELGSPILSVVFLTHMVVRGITLGKILNGGRLRRLSRGVLDRSVAVLDGLLPFALEGLEEMPVFSLDGWFGPKFQGLN